MEPYSLDDSESLSITTSAARQRPIDNTRSIVSAVLKEVWALPSAAPSAFLIVIFFSGAASTEPLYSILGCASSGFKRATGGARFSLARLPHLPPFMGQRVVAGSWVGIQCERRRTYCDRTSSTSSLPSATPRPVTAATGATRRAARPAATPVDVNRSSRRRPTFNALTPIDSTLRHRLKCIIL